MNKKILIKNAAAIVTCDSNDTVHYNCDMLIDGPSIVSIGTNLVLEEEISSNTYEIIDATGKFIYPGLINTHHHFFQTFVRNLMSIDFPNMSVVEWLDKIYPIFSQINSDVIYYSSMTAMADLLKHGCTCAFDHQYCFTTWTNKDPVDRQMEAASQLGIRYHAGRGVNTLPRSEGSTIPNEMLETTEEFLQDCQRLIDTYHDSNPFSMKQIVIAPCQPINSYEETFIQSVRLARENKVSLHTHLGEGENDIMISRYGMRTLEWCEKIGFVGPDVWIAHGWELTPEEYKVMGQTKTGISHCPAPAVLGGFPILDMRAMEKEGVLLSLGCDGSATNDSSNLLDSIRMAYILQTYYSKQRGCNCFSPYEILKLATINGAKTLGRTDLGSLEVNKAADLFMIDMNKIQFTGTYHDPKNLIARGGVTGEVNLTMVNGKVVFKDGILLGIDEQKLLCEGERLCSDVLRKRFPNIFPTNPLV